MQISFAQLQTRLRSGELPLRRYLAELEARFDRWEPLIFSFVPESRRWQRLQHDAQKLLMAYPDVDARPPLFGIPVGVKDIFHVDRLPTRAGSQLPPEVLAAAEAAVVTRLKAAGALIIGKTITTEFAWFGPGPTRNPHNPFHTPGGSSSGSAAAVAADLCALALGSQTIGSVNRPAAYCGVVGYKPSYDRISREGVIELSHSHDHVGLFARDVAGIAAAAGVLIDDWQASEPSRPLRLGIPTGIYLNHVDAAAADHFDLVRTQLHARGIETIPVAAMPNFDEIRHQHYQLLAYDAARYHFRLRDYQHLYHPRTKALIADGQNIDDETAAQAAVAKLALRRHLSELLDTHNLDLWLTPAAPGAAPAGLASTGDPVLNLPFTFAGVPTLTLPSGRTRDGLPLGIQLGGRFYQDERLLSLAVELQDVLGGLDD